MSKVNKPKPSRGGQPTNGWRIRSTLGAAIAAVLLGLFPGTGHAVDDSVWAELARVQKLEAHFDQTQTRTVLKQPLKSRGAVRFDRGTPATGSALEWQVLEPGRSTFSLIGSVARMEYPDLGVNQSFDLSQVPEASRLASSLLVWMQADAAAVAREFDATYGPDTAVLVPKDPTLRALLASITIRFAPTPWRVRTVQLLEPDGDRADIQFRGVKLDGVAIVDPAQ